MIVLGQKARDVITGFTGVAIARTEWLNGCVRVTIQPPLDKDKKHVQSETFDEEQLEVVKSEPIQLPGIRQDVVRLSNARARTGGDRPSVSRAADPKR